MRLAPAKRQLWFSTEEDKQAIWGEKEPERIVVITRNPYAWFAYALQIIFPQEQPEPGD